MLLSDRDICAQVEVGQISLDPWDPAMVQPSSVDVHLDRFFRLFDNHRYPVIDPAADQSDLTRLIEVDPNKPFVLHPGEFVLGSTFELVSLGDAVAARLEGKSSLGRLGLLTHSTAGFIDPGFTGHITLELSNTATMPILLWPGMKVGQLCFFQLTSAALAPYGQGAQGSRYQGQRGPTASRSHLNFSRADVSRGYVPPAEHALAEHAPAEPVADVAAPAPSFPAPTAAPTEQTPTEPREGE
ncbi:dCTP deaminase [Buchananella felis]|uniref:dCTP deaminase n=1 Tax=Buchananella felis TaxID=3231492 RepID=UPI003529C5C8